MVAYENSAVFEVITREIQKVTDQIILQVFKHIWSGSSGDKFVRSVYTWKTNYSSHKRCRPAQKKELHVLGWHFNSKIKVSTLFSANLILALHKLLYFLNNVFRETRILEFIVESSLLVGRYFYIGSLDRIFAS